MPAALQSVSATDELKRRPVRTADFEAENRVLMSLAETMAQSPAGVLQKLVDSARDLCQADSAGISLLDVDEDGRSCFRWKAVSGGFSSFLGTTLPRDFSPCGAVLDANQTLLMSEPVRYFEYIANLPLPVHEVLLVPFYRGEKPVGTVWVVAHTRNRHFDGEDERIVRSLSQFAADATLALEQAENRDSGEFLAILAHEIRNVMAPMSGALRIVKVSDDRLVRERAREMMERQLAHLSRLVEDLTDSARISSGKLSLDFQVTDLCDIVRNALEATRGRIEASRQNVDLTMPDTVIPIRGDVTRLTQVLGNLLTNAAKYGVAGGRVVVSVIRDDADVVVKVADSGIGIDPAMLPRIFDLFVQVDSSTQHSQGGLGIGLALVKRLVEMHGGTVAAHSAGIGQGSEFAVRLPILDAANAQTIEG
jgi:signal transduction histidine kinase